MRTYLDCVPCFVRQAIDAARRVTDETAVHDRLLREILCLAAEMHFDQPPPVMGQLIHQRLRELTGLDDPYAQAKRQANDWALKLLPELQRQVAGSRDPFATAVRLAIAGNVIDLGVKSHLGRDEIMSAIGSALEDDIDMESMELLRGHVQAAEHILYLADNAGEIVFDRLLIEQIGPEKVTVAVKSGPIINDATRADAEMAGLVGRVEVIDNGYDAPGTLLDRCSAEFRARFDAADLVISKGQGNYETLNDCGRSVFFLLKAKCPVIAQDIGCRLGRLVIRSGGCPAARVS